MKPAKLLLRIQTSQANVPFRDFIRLLEALGFRRIRHNGSSHQIYAHPEVPEHMNVQDCGGQAKPYQIKQLLKLVDAYNLRISTS